MSLESYMKKGLAEAGCDEAGRGCLAGPVFAAAVLIPEGVFIQGLNDSKKLTERQRDKVFKDIMLLATVGIGIVHHSVIDRINIYEASKHAMVLAVHDLIKDPDFLLIDGKYMISTTQAGNYENMLKKD